jgi:ADP-dependent NAD(P)H-hydrate dehydratase / NAD(P)H-hydrate epimerase
VLPVLSPEDVYACDQAGVEAGTPLAQMMDRAAGAVALEARRILGGSYGQRIVVLAGKGNNGGDGLVAARMLASRGAAVTVGLPIGSPTVGEAADAARDWAGETLTDPEQIAARFETADLIVDALFGVGLGRPIDGPLATLIEAANDSGVPILAVDIPSGIDARTGQPLGEAIRATRTVSFTGPKLGLVLEPGRTHGGQIQMADIGALDVQRSARVIEARDVHALWPTRLPGGHKRTSGRLLVVAGSRAMPGAAMLVAGAAVRAGAGMTTVFAPSMIAKSIAVSVPEATTIPAVATDAGELTLQAAADLVPELAGFHALAIGPGLGRDKQTMEAVATLLAAFAGPAVVDADALHALRDTKRPEAAITVATPHSGEWGAMLGANPNDADADRLSAVKRLHEELSGDLGEVIAVLKGPGSLVYDGSQTWVDVLGGPELAQGGSGDVLTGIIGALLAQTARTGRPIHSALVAAGVYIHSAAGAMLPGPVGASHLIDNIPTALEETTV